MYCAEFVSPQCYASASAALERKAYVVSAKSAGQADDGELRPSASTVRLSKGLPVQSEDFLCTLTWLKLRQGRECLRTI